MATSRHTGRDQVATHQKPEASARGRAAVTHEDAVQRAWRRHGLSHGARPIVGAMLVGGVTLALAIEFGPIEIAFGAFTGYVTYRMLRYGVALKEALSETVEIEKGAVELADVGA